MKTVKVLLAVLNALVCLIYGIVLVFAARFDCQRIVINPSGYDLVWDASKSMGFIAFIVLAVSFFVLAVVYFVYAVRNRHSLKSAVILLVWVIVNYMVFRLIPSQMYMASSFLLHRSYPWFFNSWVYSLSLIVPIAIIALQIYEVVKIKNKMTS